MVSEANQAKIDGASVQAAAPSPRRPRVRVVSSRFMSPVVKISSSSLSGDLHMMSDRSPMHKHTVRSGSVQRRLNHHESGEVSGDENEIKSDLGRSFENPFKGKSEVFKKPQRAAVKLFKENNEARVELKTDGVLVRSSGGIEVVSRFMGPKRRPDTPIVSTSFDKNRFHRTNSGRAGSATPAAARQLHLGGMPSSAQSYPKVVATDDCESSSVQQISCSRDSIASDTSSVESSSCSSSPILLQKCRMPRQTPDQVRSSMPETIMSMTMSSRYLGDRTGNRGINGNSTKSYASPCCRSLNLSTFSGIQSNGNNLPPHPPVAKAATDAKVKKVNIHQESIHSLKMLHNRFLQWRFSNAKAEAAVRSQTRDAEIMLFSLSIKILELRESVVRKRIELRFLRRSKTLFSILDAQMPDLESWNTFEEEFNICLSEIISALLNASVQLPINGNIKIDVKGFREALSSALKVMEMIESQISTFFPMAGEVDKLVSELARVNNIERKYIEESGYLLSKTQMLQEDECSLKAQLIQLQQRN